MLPRSLFADLYRTTAAISFEIGRFDHLQAGVFDVVKPGHSMLLGRDIRCC